MPWLPTIPSPSAIAFSTATWVRKRSTSSRPAIAARNVASGSSLIARMKATSPAATSGRSSFVSGWNGSGTYSEGWDPSQEKS